jgi:hypothetical protein
MGTRVVIKEGNFMTSRTTTSLPERILPLGVTGMTLGYTTV